MSLYLIDGKEMSQVTAFDRVMDVDPLLNFIKNDPDLSKYLVRLKRDLKIPDLEAYFFYGNDKHIDAPLINRNYILITDYKVINAVEQYGLGHICDRLSWWLNQQGYGDRFHSTLPMDIKLLEYKELPELPTYWSKKALILPLNEPVSAGENWEYMFSNYPLASLAFAIDYLSRIDNIDFTKPFPPSI